MSDTPQKHALTALLDMAKKKMGKEGPDAPMAEGEEPKAAKLPIKHEEESESEESEEDAMSSLHSFLKSKALPSATSKGAAMKSLPGKKVVGKPFPKKK